MNKNDVTWTVICIISCIIGMLAMTGLLKEMRPTYIEDTSLYVEPKYIMKIQQEQIHRYTIVCNKSDIIEMNENYPFLIMIQPICAIVEVEPYKYNQSFYDYNTCIIMDDIRIGMC